MTKYLYFQISDYLTVFSIILAVVFFHYQNLKTKQHRCLDEVINRLDIITDIAVSSCSTLPYTRSEGEYEFNSKILRESIKKFKSTAPTTIFLENEFCELSKECLELLEYIEMNTPVESPDNIVLNPNGTMTNKLSTTIMVHLLANKIVSRIYKLL